MFKNLNKIIKESVHNLLMEIASPIVWHFTTVEAAINILENDEFVLSNTDDPEKPWKTQNEKLTGYHESRPYYFSTTRSKSIYDGYSWTICHRDGIGGVRIQLNGDMLNNRLHAKAGNFHSKKTMQYSNNSIKGHYMNTFANKNASLKDIKTREITSQDEKEDTFWSPTEDIPNAIKYIQRIDVIVYRYNESVEELYNLCEENGIPCFLYDDEQAFSLQSRNYYDEDKAFEKVLQQAMKDFDKGYSAYTCFDNIIDLDNGLQIFELQGRYNIFTEDAEFVNDEWSSDYDEIYSQAEMMY